MSLPRVLAVSLLVAFAPACQGKGGGAGDAADGPANLAPRFTGKTTEGDYVQLEDYRGKVVLLNIWATWCAPCRKELPELRKMHHDYGPDFMVLGVSIDKPSAFAKVQGLMRQFQIDYPVVFDPDGDSIGKFNVTGYPTSLLLGKDGAIRWRRNGIVRPHDPEAEAEIKAALAAG